MRRALLLLALMPAGCSRNPSAVFDTAGVHAAETVRLFEYFLAVTTAVWFAVIAVLFVALYRQRVAGETAHFHLRPDASTDRSLGVIIVIAITVTVLILTSFVGFSYAIDRRLLVLDSNPAMEIDVTARQWWWELRYSGDKPSDTFTTANEIHVPVGVPVRLKLNSTDVIHSLWLPNIAGKQDIIPGREGDLVIRVDRPGVWRGQCGEFCGLQHAFMAITLFADQPEDFEQWKRHQRSDAAVPQTESQKRGRSLFETGPCGLCHVIRGTSASGYSSNAPDLTHLKSRSTIGAGAAPNSKGYLGGWIVDPHGIKPGVHMPAIQQEPEDLHALLDYLETLR